MADLAGQTFGGCELEVLIGRGGMGEVYRAVQKSLERRVAVKILPADMAEDPAYVERFMQEAKSIARLSHPNVVQVFDAGRQENYYYIIMELVEGGTLKDLISSRHIPRPLEALDFMEQTAMGLGAAHQQGIIHRDLKPGNLMLGSDRRLKVADFGLAKTVQDRSQEITKTGEVVGTPAYMSPEQCEGNLTDHRSDIYSLGATFYHFITGKPPFAAENAMQVMFKHIKERPVPIASVRPDIPPALSNIIDRCMAKDPFDRYQSCEELILDLRRAAENQPVPPYVPGEGRKRFAADADEATGVCPRPQEGVTHTTGIRRKKQLSAKDQERRGDLEAAKGRWSFALMAYKEALKVFPDSTELKRKAEEAKTKVEEEALEQTLSKARRLCAEERFEEAYDTLAAAIRGAPDEEHKQKARSLLREIQQKEEAFHRRARRSLALTLMAFLLLVPILALTYLKTRPFIPFLSDTSESERTSPPTATRRETPAHPIKGETLDLDTVPHSSPSEATTTRTQTRRPKENPLLKMLLEAARTGPSDAPSPTGSSPETGASVPKPSAESIQRKRVRLGDLSAAVPVFLEPEMRDTSSIVLSGPDPWGGAWKFVMTSHRSPPEEDQEKLLAPLLHKLLGSGDIPAYQRWRPVAGFGKAPEVRCEMEDGTIAEALVLKLPGGFAGLGISYKGENEDIFWRVYNDLLASCRIMR